MPRKDPPRRMQMLPSVRGLFTMYRYKGDVHVRSWPRKPTKKQLAKAAVYRNRFKAVNHLAKYASEDQLQFARLFAQKGLYNVRDILIQSMYGRLFPQIRTDQQRMYSVLVRDDISAMLDVPHTVYRALPHRTGPGVFELEDTRTWWMATLTDLSSLLDVITSTPGAMLVRGDTVWEALAPGDADQILTAHGAGFVPTWADPAPVNPRYYMSAGLVSGAANTASTPFCGQIIAPAINMVAKGVQYTLTQVNAATYHCELWELSGNTLGTKRAVTTGFTGSGTAVKTTYELWNTAAALTAGLDYCVAVVRDDGTDTSVIGLHFAVFQWSGIPLAAVPNTNIALAKKAPAAGQAITRAGSTNSWCCAIDAY